MPSDSLSIAISSGFGIGIIAGIVSGVCYIAIQGFSSNRPVNHRSLWHCSVCGEKFRSIEGILETDKVVTCIKCGKKVCRKKCSNQDRKEAICQVCLNPESWFKGILKALHPSSIIRRSNAIMDDNRIEEIDEDLESIKKKEKEQIRDFIERLVETMLGGGIDNTSINLLYKDKKYDMIMNRYHCNLSNALTDLGSALHMSIANLPIIGQSPCSAHADLKVLIQRIIQEAVGLPVLKKNVDHPGELTEATNRTYEDLLATAIINKVVENYQDDLPTSSTTSASSRKSTSSTPNNKEYFFGEETLDSKWKNANGNAGDIDTTSVSSLEEWVRSDSSAGSTKYVNHKSLTVQQGIEEESSSDDDRISRRRSKNKLGWKENWMLQKRQFTGNASPIPVPMLVPNPTVEAKVLIGDRDAEDTTDLSDAGSDYEDEKVTPNVKVFSEAQNYHVEDEDLLHNSTGILEKKETIVDQFAPNHEVSNLEEENNNNIKTSNTLVETSEPTSFNSHVEQDTEYTEKYATLPRTIMIASPNPKDNLETVEATEIKKTIVDTNGTSGVFKDSSHEFEAQQFKGSYSEREKRKWENAVEMKNNPYTEENINRRLSQSSTSSTKSLFGRDYYVKEAAKAAGARKLKTDDIDDAVTQEMEKPSNQPDCTNEILFKAVPAVVDTNLAEDVEIESLSSPTPSNILLEVSSDSDLSIERVYNLNSGKVFEKVGGFHKEIVKRTSSPEGITFTASAEFDKEIASVDENHNSTSESKQTFLKSLTEEDTDNTITEDVFMDATTESEHLISENVKENDTETFSSNIREVPTIKIEDKNIITDIEINKYSIQEVSVEFSTDGENYTSEESSLIHHHSGSEINDLKDKHLVKNKRSIFCKSDNQTVPLHKTFVKKTDAIQHENNDEESTNLSAQDISVNDLKKKFDSENTKEGIKQLHSLTARSISKEIRKELQEVDNTNTNTVNASIIHEEIIQEDQHEEKASVFPNTKSRIKFFENLNTKKVK
ncbi:hypothetical protein FQA39_LY14956 [Lamprigera yunnana]|nr:hypothetical protein FQA39_LY14956 [Lamprigera yunnana]